MDAHERDALVSALGEVMEADAAREFFNDPVDAVALRLHDYHDIVTRPMSLSRVRDRLGAGNGGGADTTGADTTASTSLVAPYPSFAAAMDDIRLVWRNCRAYNASPHAAQLREKCDALHDALLAALRRRGVTTVPPPSDVPEEARRADCAISEADVPERYNLFLGEALPYRLLDDFIVCRSDDAFSTAPVEAADAHDRWLLEHGSGEGDAPDADAKGDRPTSRTARSGEDAADGKKADGKKAPPALAAYGWLAVPNPKTLEPEDDPPVSVSALTESTQAAGLAEGNGEGEDGAPRKKKAKSSSGRVKVWLPRIVDWSIDYENPQSLWLITPNGWYRALDPSPEYVSLFRAGAQRKFDFATRAVNALKRDPLGSYDDVLPKVLAPPPKPGRPRGRPPKERGDEPPKGGRGRGRGRGRGGRGGRGKNKQPLSDAERRDATEAVSNEADGIVRADQGETRGKKETEKKEKEPASALKEKPKEKPKPRDAPPEKRWGDSGRHYAESELVEEREFVLEQLEASVLAGTIVTSTGKLSRHMKAFAVILEEKGDAADLDKRRRAEREQRWDVAEARGSMFSTPPPATAPRNSADAHPVKTLAKADALALAAAASARARRSSKKTGGPPPPARRDFGVEPGMVGDALAVWDMCSRHAELLRLPPFPFARLAAALCPERKSGERGDGGADATPASAATPLAAAAPAAAATPSVTPAPMRCPDYPAASVGIPTAFSDAVGAEWLAAQPGDPELASECLLRDVHCAFLRVIANADVELVGAPARSTAEGGGGALPVGWPERARRLIESRPVTAVKDAAFGAARSLRTRELWDLPPRQRLALLSCLASLAADAPAFGARAKSAKDARERGANAELLGVDTTGARYWRLGGTAGIGAAFVERPGFEAGELSEPPPPPPAAGFEAAEAEATPTKAAAGEHAGGRASSRRRSKPAKFEDTSVPAPTPSGKSSGGGAGKQSEESSAPSETKWCWYPASSFPALAAWLRASGDDGEAALADALLEPPDALLEELEALTPAGVGKDGEDDDDAMDVTLPDDAKEREKDKTTSEKTPFSLPSDPVAATAAVAAALAMRKRGGGTALDGYVGLDRPLIRGVSPEGPRALVALRASLTQTLSGFPFWEGADFARRLAKAVARARSAPAFADAAAAITETEALFHDAGVLVVGWRSRRAAWRAAVDSARTLPQLALCAHELAEHRAKDKGRVKMLREAFQRVGRALAASGPPEARLPVAPFLPQVRETVVLSALALRRATAALASSLEAGDAKRAPAGAVSEARLRALGVPCVPPDLPALTQCRVEFAGYRKGDPAASTPAARIPHAWYLLTPLQAMAPEAAKEAGATAGEAPPSAHPPPPLPASPLVLAQHVFPGMAGDFLLPFDQTEAVLRRPWRAGDRVRRTFVDLRQNARGGEDRAERGDGGGDASSAGKQGRRSRPVGDVIGGVVVKTDWWRNAEEPRGDESVVGVTSRNKSKRRVRSPWTCEPLGAVCVRWDAPPPTSAESQAGEPATAADGPECSGAPACGWISPWDVEPDAEEERRRVRELAQEAKKLERDRWLANFRAERERRDRERREAGLEPLGDDDDASPPVPKKFSAASTLGAPRAVAVPPAAGFAEALQAFHAHHPSGPGRPLKVPTFCHVELDLHRVFAEVQARGGFRAVTDAKRWREVCRSLGHDLSGQTSASFAMRQNYERCLLDYEAHLFEEERRESGDEAKATGSERKRENARASPGEMGAAKRPKRK